MSAGRVYWGQILSVLAAFAASLVITTQWTAGALGYQSQLGTPDAILLGYPLYAPWKFFLWWYAYDAYARYIFETGALIFLVGVIISVAIAFGFSLWRSREARCRPGPRAGRRKRMFAGSISPRAMALSWGVGSMASSSGMTGMTMCLWSPPQTQARASAFRCPPALSGGIPTSR